MRSICAAVALVIIAPTAAPVSAQSTSFTGVDEGQLAAAVWRIAPAVLAARRDLVEVEAARDHAELLPNPNLTATWATLPIGARPMNVPWKDVPSYTVAVGQLIEIGKRGPRRRATEAARAASFHRVREAFVVSFFAVLESLSDQAAATARLAVIQRLVRDSEESLQLQRLRADKGDVAPLEVDRLEVEHSRLLSSLREAETVREVAKLDCAVIVGPSCPAFADEEEARRFLDGEMRSPAASSIVQARPDFQALSAEGAQLAAELELAERLRIPDPVASIGYTRDQFAAAGNQSNSLAISLSIPLPLFDHGQSERARVHRARENNEAMRQVLQQSTLLTVEAERRQLALLAARARFLEERAVPTARGVVERTEAAFRRGGVGFPDVLLARRVFEELELDRIEVLAAAHRGRVNLRRTTADVPWPTTAPSASRRTP